MLRFLVKAMSGGGLVLLIAAAWLRDALPETAQLREELYEEPAQVKVQKAAFERTVDGITYQIRPLYSYDLYGLVVSHHRADSWWDYLHLAWKDKLNVTDLCVVWGHNLQVADLAGMSFSSGQFQCFWQTRSQATWDSFSESAIANNHMLTDDPSIAKRLRETRIGDQVHFRGYLSEYSHNEGLPFKRGTSTVRTDTGNGACETVFLEEFENLRPGGGPWRTLFWAALALLGLGALGWLCLPPDLKQ